MKHRNLRPKRGQTVSPPLPDPGPRPLSARQQEARARLTGRDIIDRAVPPRAITPPADGETRNWRTSPNRRRIRDTETTRVRRRRDVTGEENSLSSRTTAGGRNRRRVDYPRIALRWALAALAVESVAVLLFSPRFRVKSVTISGNTTVPTERLRADLGIRAHDNLFRLPVGRMRARVTGEPPVDSAEIHRSLPGTVRLIVRERQPWASVCVSGEEGCYTIDQKLVPFRKTDQPEPGLPRLRLAQEAQSVLPAVTLGKPMTAPGLREVSACLVWAKKESYPLASLEIAPDGKLCLNKVGGVQVQLGTATDLDKKLSALSLLLRYKPDLRTGTDLAYINLYAYDAPAIMPRSAVAADTAASTTATADDSTSPPAAPGRKPTLE